MKFLCRIPTMMAGRGRRRTSRDRGRFRPTAEALGARSSPSTVDLGVSAVIPATGEVAVPSDPAETDDDDGSNGAGGPPATPPPTTPPDSGSPDKVEPKDQVDVELGS